MDLSIIIVSYNTKRLLRQCLQSITNIYEVLVVDNGSVDGSPEMVRKEFPRVKLIENKRNLGFAKAVNQGIGETQGEYILLLNPDTEAKKGALKILFKFAQKHPKAGVIGGRLFNPDGTIQGSCFHQLSILNAIKEFWLGEKSAFEKYAPKTNKPIEVEAVVGACMLIPRKVIDQVGIFDERYFLYFEDLDFCRRVKKTGFKVYYLPKAELIHHHGVSGKGLPVSVWLKESSKIYNGILRHYLINFIIWTGQKWRKFLGNTGT